MDSVAIRRRASYPPTKSRNVRRGKTRNAIRFGPIASAGLDRHPVALSERLVRFGIDAHPELRGCAGERAADLRRCAQREHPVRDLGLGRHERARGYHRSGTDAGAVQNRRAVADQALLTQGGRVDRAVVANRRARAHLGSLARRDVHDRAVLHVRAAADDDRVEVGAEHGVVPHRRVLLDRDVPDEHRGRGDERGRMDLRASSLEAEQWHGLDPRSMLGLLPSYAKPRGGRGECRPRASPPSRPRRRRIALRRPSSWRSRAIATLGAAAFSAGARSRGVTSISTPPPSARTRAWTDCKTGSGVARSSSARRRRGARSRGRAGSRVTWISWRRRRAPDGSRPAWTPT